MSIPDSPLSRDEQYLNAIARGVSSGIPAEPMSRLEIYLNAIATGDKTHLPEKPMSRIEMYLDTIARSGGGGAVLESLYANINGDYYPPEGVDGWADVHVDVEGGGGIRANPSFVCNWDFSRPINTRGQSSYVSTSTNVSAIDGWRVQKATVTLEDGGIRVAQTTPGTQGYFIQDMNVNAAKAFELKTMTISAIVDGVGYSQTVQVGDQSTSGGKAYAQLTDDIFLRIYANGTTRWEFTIDALENTVNHIINAIKFEAGSTQTLYDSNNHLIVHQDDTTEQIMFGLILYYNP